MTEAIFIRALLDKDKEGVVAHAIGDIRSATVADTVFVVRDQSFREVPGSPLAYWVGDPIRRVFRTSPPFESNQRTAKQGLATALDFRFVRLWWEVDPQRLVAGTPGTSPETFRSRTFHGRPWVPFAKGGEYMPYHADVHLVVNWERDGEEIRNFVDLTTGKLLSRPQSTEYYFRPGVTWPLETV